MMQVPYVIKTNANFDALLFSLDQIYWKRIPSKVSEVARDLIAISCQPSEVFSESIIF